MFEQITLENLDSMHAYDLDFMHLTEKVNNYIYEKIIHTLDFLWNKAINLSVVT